jgi:hypothetical protein
MSRNGKKVSTIESSEARATASQNLNSGKRRMKGLNSCSVCDGLTLPVLLPPLFDAPLLPLALRVPSSTPPPSSSSSSMPSEANSGSTRGDKKPSNRFST